MLTASLYSPLEKFLLGRPVEAQPYTKASCLGGEEFAFQVVLQRDGWDITPVQVEAASPLGGVEVFQVGQVPCAMPAYPARHDEGYLTTQPGLFPDPLLPLEGAAVEVSAFLPTVLWVNGKVPQGCPGGTTPSPCALPARRGRRKPRSPSTWWGWICRPKSWCTPSGSTGTAWLITTMCRCGPRSTGPCGRSSFPPPGRRA